jgi:hypothetical protein
VDPHSHADGGRFERFASLRRGRDRVGCPRERDEERIPLRVDLDAGVALEGVSQRLAVRGEEIGVAVAVLLEEPRRALDVGEEEGDGAGGKIAPAHDAIFAPAGLSRPAGRPRPARRPGQPVVPP